MYLNLKPLVCFHSPFKTLKTDLSSRFNSSQACFTELYTLLLFIHKTLTERYWFPFKLSEILAFVDSLDLVPFLMVLPISLLLIFSDAPGFGPVLIPLF